MTLHRLTDQTSATPRAGTASRMGRASFVALLAAGATITMAGVSMSAAATPALQRATVKPYSGVLENAKHYTLYVLSAEKGKSIHCKGQCLSTWYPMLVKTSVMSVSVSGGVAGTIGFVKRTPTMKQVTFNGYPVYQFSGDSGANQTNGQAIVADGGTWYLIHASATSASGTKMTGASSASVTTTTKGSGGGYY